MAISAYVTMKPVAIETLETNVGATTPANRKVTHDQYSIATTELTASTTPPVSKVANFVGTLSSGALTIDLTSLTGTNGATVDGTGLKVQSFWAKGNSNANAITLTEGASDGYALAGNTWKVALLSGQAFQFYGNDATPDIDATHKDIDMSGTGAQSVLCSIIMG